MIRQLGIEEVLMEKSGRNDVAAGHIEMPHICTKAPGSTKVQTTQIIREHIDRLLRKAFVGRQGETKNDG